MFEQVTDYKSACKVLCTITQAINFIANGNKPWIPEYKQSKLIKTWYSWWQIDWDKIKDGSDAGFFYLYSDYGLGDANAGVDTHLQFISEDAAEYAAKTFKPLYMKHIFGID